MARFTAAVAAHYAAHSAKMEAQTPGLRCPGPTPHETCEQARQRLMRIGEEFHRLRSEARCRAIAEGWPGITADTPLNVLPVDGAPDPVGDFMRHRRSEAHARLSAICDRLSERAAPLDLVA